MRTLNFSLGIVLSGLLLGAACGGGASSEPKTADEVEERAESSSSEQEESAEEEAAEESAPRISCDDGTCFSCGETLCLNGWYCDESAKGGPACGWHPDCIKKPSCGCLKKALGAGCSCEERSGALHVTCN